MLDVVNAVQSMERSNATPSASESRSEVQGRAHDYPGPIRGLMLGIPLALVLWAGLGLLIWIVG